MDTNERLRLLEERLAVLERIVAEAQARFDAFARGPGKKILRTLGIVP
jgi:hypothetical protein